MLKFLKNIGPGAIVSAAFIGPGTITTATLAGSSYGFTLLWAVLFSTLATITLQEMTMRLGVVSRQGLGESVQNFITSKWLRIPISILIITAIFVGNAAYEAGNLTGAMIGIQCIFGQDYKQLFLPILVGIAAILLWFGSYKVIERFLIGLVSIMGLTFIISAILSKPDLGQIVNGLFTHKNPTGGALFIVGLIGTPIVPYNLFLHAAASKEKWTKEELKNGRIETVVSIFLGGVITGCILICGAAANGSGATDIQTISKALNPLLGESSVILLGLGYLAAGFSSSITAPLAAALALKEIAGWRDDWKSVRFKTSWMIVLLVGLVFSLFTVKPLPLIFLAQVTNGLLLPIIVAVLLWAMNNKSILGSYVNGLKSNISGLTILIICCIVSWRSLHIFFNTVNQLYG